MADNTVEPQALVWSEALGIPQWNHFTAFAADWWDDRRKRDYRIDPKTGGVRLVPGSETAGRVCASLRQQANKIYLNMVQPKPGEALN